MTKVATEGWRLRKSLSREVLLRRYCVLIFKVKFDGQMDDRRTLDNCPVKIVNEVNLHIYKLAKTQSSWWNLLVWQSEGFWKWSTSKGLLGYWKPLLTYGSCPDMHTSNCETKSNRILALLDSVSHKIFKSHRIFIPFNKLMFEELEINHTLAWLSPA